MKIALLSDIHANLEALDAVLQQMDAQHTGTALVCLGDIVGYGPDPGPCIDRLRERGVTCLRGNHDEMVVGLRDFSRCIAAGITAVRWTRRQLTPQQCGFLRQLPIRAELPQGLAICHGDLDDADHYLSDASVAEGALARLAAWSPGSHVLACGHTHHAAVYRQGDGRWSEGVAAHVANHVAIDATRRTLVNPGAVGQSRDGEPLAAFAVLDLGTHQVQFHRIAYDHRRTEHKMRLVGLSGGVVLQPPRGLQKRVERARTRWARLWAERENRRLGYPQGEGH